MEAVVADLRAQVSTLELHVADLQHGQARSIEPLPASWTLDPWSEGPAPAVDTISTADKRQLEMETIVADLCARVATLEQHVADLQRSKLVRPQPPVDPWSKVDPFFDGPAPAAATVQCCNCDSRIESCYNPQSHPQSEDESLFICCLQARGWDKKKNNWRCGRCHHQVQNCIEADLGEICKRNGHGVWQHPYELVDFHGFIEHRLDYAVARFLELGFTFRWHHETLGGNFPGSSPTDWMGGIDGSRTFSRIDFYRPATDWTNRRWCEVALHMRMSTHELKDARHCTYASWMECLVGLIYAVGTNGSKLPAGNRLELVYHGRCQKVAEDDFTNIVKHIWYCLQTIGISLPRFDFTESTQHGGFLAITDIA